MRNSSIIDDVIQHKQTNKKAATHFAVCKAGRIRYLISLNGGKRRLVANLSSYSKKHELLIKVLNFLPFGLLKLGKLGFFISVKFCDEISQYIDEVAKSRFTDYNWNMIVGTYDDNQKVVVQCYGIWEGKHSAIYFKIGNRNSAKEMVTEIDFLQSGTQFKSFIVPRFICSRKMENGYSFNIQVTEEFTGHKVEPVLADEIYRIYKEIAESRGLQIVDGIPFGFSHGDFAPWNLKVENGMFTVFDWEHCRVRFIGFDLIHYVFQIETLLNGKSKDEAIQRAIATFKKFDQACSLNTDLLTTLYFEEYKKTY